MAEGQRVGRRLRKVHHAATMEGAAIVDAHDDRAAVHQVGDAGIGRQRHRRMCGRDAVAVIDFAIGGTPAMEGLAIPGGRADLGEADRLLERGIALAGHGIGLADELASATLRHLFALGHHALAGGAVFRLREGADFLGAATGNLVAGAVGREQPDENDASHTDDGRHGRRRRHRSGHGGSRLPGRKASVLSHSANSAFCAKNHSVGSPP